MRPTHLTPAVLLVAGLTTLTAACEPRAQQPAEEAAVDADAILAELDSVRTAFEDAFRAGDAETMASFYSEDAVYSHPGLPPVRGRDSIQSVLERTHPPGGTLEISPTDVIVLDGDRVFEYGIGTVTFTPERADEPVEIASTYTALIQRTPAGWRLHREALSANAPMPGEQ